MTQTVISRGTHNIAPYLVAPRAAELLDFMKKAFGAHEALRMDAPDGGIMHAEIIIGDSLLELGDANPQFSAMPTAIRLYVPDADTVYAKALAAGAASHHPPADWLCGDRACGVQDRAGNLWWIATHKAGSSFAPAGFRSITPYLRVENALALIEFTKAVFDGELMDRTDDPGGRLVHAAVRIGDSAIEISECTPDAKPMPGAIHLFVKNSDETYRRAIAAGAKSLSEPEDKPYGERSANIQDPNGNYWFIATLK